MAHTLMYMDTHAHTHIDTDAPMQRLACTQSAERSRHTVCVRKRYLKRICCLLLWSTPRGKHTHAKTHTYTWCSINLKETGAFAWLWTQTHNPCPIKKKRERERKQQLLFKSIPASIIALGLCVCVSVFVSFFVCAYALFVCIEGKHGHFSRTTSLLCVFL